MKGSPLVRPLAARGSLPSLHPNHAARRLFAAQPALSRRERPEPQPVRAARTEGSRGAPSRPVPGKTPNDIWKTWVKLVKGTVLEAMAATVPKNDRDFFATRWGFVVPKVEVVVEKAPDAMPDTQAATEATEEPQPIAEPAKMPSHPVLGDLVTDLGYKRTYTSKLQNLLTVPIWKKQRTLRPERANKIAAFKLKGHTAGQPIGLPGVITLYQDVNSGKLGIVDGQHRLAALVTLCEKQVWDSDTANITVDVFDTTDESEVKDLFIEINSAEPLKLVDLPGEGADEELKDVLSDAVDILADKYPDMFKASQRCRPPHVNKDNLRDDLYQSELLQRHGIQTAADLVSHLEEVNAKLAGRKRTEWNDLNCRVSPAKVSFKDALKKATANKFFLGLDTTWDKLL